ncbi:hypothetical protein QE152_g26422 [Popillia japonica]|uniref:Uncharacterized protein n=1 Tax=Popillia japonica TaxID=7064 RepID=A0AAW1JYA9_POPJA
MTEHDSNSDDETNEVELDEIIEDEDPEENEMQKEGVRENISSVTKSYYGRSRYKLSSECFVTRSRTQKHNIVMQLPGLKPTAKLGSTADPISVWSLLFSEDILQIVLLKRQLKSNICLFTFLKKIFGCGMYKIAKYYIL